ncbi:MAG: tRNA (adenosine(37)-N6)-threonylcarbamoyltransferase complex dimerization subunit type 1 TsaB [Phycisphaerae bacterium]|nr:tRNA (adenosine(37)-N6)-threonylcarbamoyltransferase complex dimerization subunit type 1 TsaB [Phycisphaerae bacterium]
MEKPVITHLPLTIALETSGRIGSVSIGMGQNLSDEKAFSAPLKHSAELFDTIIQLLKNLNKKPNQIEHIYISIGPGSFTGIRISVAVAKMMALVLHTKIVAVSTTDAMAINVTDKNINRIAAVIDAKRNQFFIAAFEKQNGTWQKILPDCMLTAEEFKERFDKPEKPIWLLGEGLLYYSEKFKTDNIKILDPQYWSPRAGNVFRIGAKMALEGKSSDPLSLAPFYLRRTEAEENWEKKSVNPIKAESASGG